MKTGYWKKEPDDYHFLLRYPPLSRDTAPPVTYIKPHRIPYVHLYKRIIEDDPILRDETVYPAYWQEEPLALTMAKKQYELITKHGLDVEEAYKQAKSYINTLESKAYEELKHLKSTLDDLDAQDPFSSDAEIREQLIKYNDLMSKFPSYDAVPIADRGDIEYFVQTKILKWKHVERERRMKDPLFAARFEELMVNIFPYLQNEREGTRLKQGKAGYLELLEHNHNLRMTRMRTSQPFYFEDYKMFFDKLKEKPNLSRWSERNRETLSRWIIDTLAYQEILETRTPGRVQSYLDQLRSQFFPMIKYPEEAETFVLPSLDDLKKLLYSNDIGYKPVGKKLFVKRFYNLPVLLFPKQTWATSILSDQNRVKVLLTNKNSFMKEIYRAGFDESSKAELEKKLQDYVDKHHSGLNLPSYGNTQHLGMTSLDELLGGKDDFLLQKLPALNTNRKSPVTPPNIVASEVPSPVESSNTLVQVTPVKSTKTVLEIEREELLREMIGTYSAEADGNFEDSDVLKRIK